MAFTGKVEIRGEADDGIRHVGTQFPADVDVRIG